MERVLVSRNGPYVRGQENGGSVKGSGADRSRFQFRAQCTRVTEAVENGLAELYSLSVAL